MIASWRFHYVNLMTLWPFQALRPLSLHIGVPLGHYLYGKYDQIILYFSGLFLCMLFQQLNNVLKLNIHINVLNSRFQKLIIVHFMQ